MANFLTYLSVTALCAFKFMVGITTGVATQMSFFELFFCSSVGGTIGMVVYTLFGNQILNWWNGRKKEQKSVTSENWKVKVWNKFGLVGVAFLTPPILSQVVGTTLSLSFGTPARKVIFAMTLSTIFWSLVFSYAGEQVLKLLSFS